jgi:hypothetical protein
MGTKGLLKAYVHQDRKGSTHYLLILMANVSTQASNILSLWTAATSITVTDGTLKMPTTISEN